MNDAEAATQRAEIIAKLKALKLRFAAEGVGIVGIFGSYANGTCDRFSDVDIAYEIDRETFSRRYRDGFGKILRLEEIRKILESELHKRVDLVSLHSRNRRFLEQIRREMVYV